MGFEFRIKTDTKVKHWIFKYDMPIIKRTIRFHLQLYNLPNTWSKGISSRCKDGRHILFLDYDNQELKQIEDETKYLQKTYKLSPAHIFINDTEDSYHVIFLDKFPLIKAFEILSESNSEWSHVNSIKIMRGREWVLRIYPKGNRAIPKYLKTITPKNKSTNEISTAHKRFLEIYYSIPTLKYLKEDNILELPTIDYTTGNRV